MKRKDMLFAIMLCVPMIGLGHFYVGDKVRGAIILGVQILSILLMGVLMNISPLFSKMFNLIFFGVAIWALYDTVMTVKLVNDNL